MVTLEKILPAPKATEKLAASLAPYLVAGDVILLKGELGAGKSHFARALIRALGCQQQHLPSPTFTLVQTYDDTRLPVAHADFYRLNDPSEVAELALHCFIEHGVLIVEWPEKAPADMFPPRALTITFTDIGPDGRMATLSGEDSWAPRFGFFAPEMRRASTEHGRQAYLQKQSGRKGDVITPVSVDASFRSYWRVRLPEGTRILMDAPPPMENLALFIDIGKHLSRIGVHVPHVYNADLKQGYALLEDLGDTTFYRAIQEGASTQTLYEKAVDVLVHIALADHFAVKDYTTTMYQDEACLFTDWYMPRINEHATYTACRRQFRELWLPLVEHIRAVPKTAVLWDYHCQNLMLLSPVGNTPTKTSRVENIADVGVLDFQDARLGPVSHDLASLLYDVRFDVPETLHDLLIRRLVDGLDGAVTLDAFTLSMKLSTIQNLLRIAGVFTRLAYRDGKTNYLTYMPRLWRHLDKLLATTPEADALRKFIDKNTPTTRELSA